MSTPPEPPIGSEVVDKHDVRWGHVEGTHGNHYWMRADTQDGDPESWVRVNEFGPLRLAWLVNGVEELSPLSWVDPKAWLS